MDSSAYPTSSSNLRFSYRVGQYRLLLEPGVRSELLTRKDIQRLPFAPSWCAGLVGVRGDLFPVINMHQVLLGSPAQGKQQLLWLHPEQFVPAVVSCDELPKQLAMPGSDRPYESLQDLPGWVHRAWQDEEQGLVLELDHVRLFQLISRSRK
ncbi:MAG: hypothetical protein CR991_09190 [Proteobacteria bacterium]|nr:MAG: hypothetical protein CR991_09190 [Pseudomonadota bacterium]